MRPLVRSLLLSFFAVSASATVAPPLVYQTPDGFVPVNLWTPKTVSISNSNSVPLTGVGLTIHLPAGIEAAPPTSGDCNGGTITAIAGSHTITLAGGNIAANSGCMFGVSVVSAVPGQYAVTTNGITSNESGPSSASVPSTILVFAHPAFTLAFADPAPRNARTTLTFTIQNPNSFALSSVDFFDTFPAGLLVDTPSGLSSSCGGNVILGTGSVALINGALPASGTCSISVNVIGTTPGTKVNVAGPIDATPGGSGATATATITIDAGAIPSLSGPMLALLALALYGAGLLVLRR